MGRGRGLRHPCAQLGGLPVLLALRKNGRAVLARTLCPAWAGLGPGLCASAELGPNLARAWPALGTSASADLGPIFGRAKLVDLGPMLSRVWARLGSNLRAFAGARGGPSAKAWAQFAPVRTPEDFYTNEKALTPGTTCTQATPKNNL